MKMTQKVISLNYVGQGNQSILILEGCLGIIIFMILDVILYELIGESISCDFFPGSGFVGAMISNLAFVFRNIFSKRGMKGKSVGGMNYYACLSILSLLILTPFAIAIEGPQMWTAGWQKALSQIGPHFVWYAITFSLVSHL